MKSLSKRVRSLVTVVLASVGLACLWLALSSSSVFADSTAVRCGSCGGTCWVWQTDCENKTCEQSYWLCNQCHCDLGVDDWCHCYPNQGT